jgi:hypothetical protein
MRWRSDGTGNWLLFDHRRIIESCITIGCKADVLLDLTLGIAGLAIACRYASMAGSNLPSARQPRHARDTHRRQAVSSPPQLPLTWAFCSTA